MRLIGLFGVTLLSVVSGLSVSKAYTLDLNTRNFYVGGGVGGSQVSLDGGSKPVREYTYVWGKSHSDHFNAELRGGYQIKRDVLYVAGELFGQLLNSKTQIHGVVGQGPTPITFHVDPTFSIQYLYGFRGKAGINLSNKISLYGIVGFAQAPISAPVEINAKEINAFEGSARGRGLLYGVGLSFDATERISLTAEYHIARFTLDHLIDSIETYRYLNLALHSSNIQTLMIGANFLF